MSPGLLALALMAGPPLSGSLFGPPDGPLRLAGGFTTGQLDAGTAKADHRRTGRVSAEWLFTQVRVGLGYRYISSSVERTCTPVAGEDHPGQCLQGGASGLGSGHEVALSGGAAFEWAAASAGLATIHRRRFSATGTASTGTDFTPAATVRLGPADFLCVRAAWHDLSPEVPGAGEGRVGLEFTPGEARVLFGVVREFPSWGVLLAAQVPLSEHLDLAVTGAAHPTQPGSLIELGAGFVAHFSPGPPPGVATP